MGRWLAARIEAGAACLLGLAVCVLFAIGVPPSQFVQDRGLWGLFDPLILPLLLISVLLTAASCLLLSVNARRGALVCIAGLVASMLGVLLAWGVDAEGSLRSLLLPVATLLVPALVAADAIRRIRRVGPPEEMGGLQLTGDAWEVEGKRIDPPAFFRTLTVLLGTDATLFLEGGLHPRDVERFLRAHQVEGPTIARGTIWPRAEVVHLPATEQILSTLAELAEHCASPELCDHLHVYRDGVILLQWHDAFTTWFLVSKRVSVENLDSFCRALGFSYGDA